jgi:hypothetical protein
MLTAKHTSANTTLITGIAPKILPAIPVKAQSLARAAVKKELEVHRSA